SIPGCVVITETPRHTSVVCNSREPPGQLGHKDKLTKRFNRVYANQKLHHFLPVYNPPTIKEAVAGAHWARTCKDFPDKLTIPIRFKEAVIGMVPRKNSVGWSFHAGNHS